MPMREELKFGRKK